ncbi:hypothetical protein EDD22DRAFT_955958 [Suillus occidentalis]|nr:hypothetical protein EDD22DRAFT_955958 [Suillus occidentalis]
MFSASFQETLARYSDPSQNPYVQVRSQTPKPSSSQHLEQTLHPGLDVSLGAPSANQWTSRWKFDIRVFEQLPQVLDSRGCYIQSRIGSQSSVPQISPEHENVTPLHCGTHPRPCVQPVLSQHANLVKSSCYTDEKLSAVPAPMNDAATTVNHTQSVPDASDVLQMLSSQSHAPPRFWSKHQLDSGATDGTMSVPAPANLDVQPSASGSHVDPIVITDESDACFVSEISRPPMRDATAENKTRDIDKGKADSRREADNGEAEKRELTRMETEKPEIERQESAAKEAETKKKRRVSPTSKLLRIERKLDNEDSFMGWYKSRSSSELRCPRECIEPQIGDVYVHSCKKEGISKFQLWVREISAIWVKAQIFYIHPKINNRRLTLTTTGEPYWSTKHSLLASGSRESASKVADMTLY